MPPDMPAAKLRPTGPEHGDEAARHVLAAVAPDALDDGGRARVAHGEALARAPAHEQLARGRAVERRVADGDAARRLVAGVGGRPHDDARARQALADVVVGLALEVEHEPAHAPGAEALPGRAREPQRERAVGERVGPEAAHDLAGEQRADRAVGVVHARRSTVTCSPRASAVAGQREHLAVERRGGRGARDAAEARERALGPDGRREQRAEVDAGAAVADLAREVGAADEIVEAAHADRAPSARAPPRPRTAGTGARARACPAKRRRSSGSCVAMPTGQVLRWQTRIMMQPAATSGAVEKPNSSAPEQRADDDVEAGAQPAVDLQADAAAQVVADEHLLGLGEAELPGHAGVPDRRRGGGAGAAVHAGDHDVVGAGLGDAGGDRADARERDELDADLGRRVGAAQVVDQLREVLDRVDVVVRGRRDQADARRRVAQARDLDVDLVAGQLAALARLGALRDLDLQHVGVDQVGRRDAEARGGDLLDRRAARIAVGVELASGARPRRPRRCWSGRRGG